MTSSDPMPIPSWVTNPEAAYPCPCGEPMDVEFVVVRGEKGLIRLYHPECIDRYLETDEDDEDGDEYE